jgi:thiol-disulfide isomerase/thioredoxin
MRHLLAGLIGLALLAPARADEKKSDEKAASEPKSANEKFNDLQKGFREEVQKLGQEFQKATTPEEKQKIKDKAFKEVAGETAKKMLALAAENSKDPVARKALVWACLQGAQSPQAPEAVGRLLKDYPNADELGQVCEAVGGRPDGDALIREIRSHTTNAGVKVQAGVVVAEALRDKNDEASSAEAEKLLEEVVARAKETNAPGRAVSQAEEALKDVKKFGIGKVAPVAESKDLDDKDVKLADLKGKVVVLDFWATWCGPCRSMIPHERDMVKKLDGKKFAFVSVSADDEVKTLKDFLEKESMPWTHWFAGKGGDVLKGWNIHAFPTIFVIDSKGVIRAKYVGAGPETEKKLEDLVEKLVKEAS